MVDISIVFMGVINQLRTGGHHPVFSAVPWTVTEGFETQALERCELRTNSPLASVRPPWNWQHEHDDDDYDYDYDDDDDVDDDDVDDDDGDDDDDVDDDDGDDDDNDDDEQWWWRWWWWWWFVSLCSPNAHGHFTRAKFRGNLQGIGRMIPPRLNTRPINTYRKNPSVWPHCLGNKNDILYISYIIKYKII